MTVKDSGVMIMTYNLFVSVYSVLIVSDILRSTYVNRRCRQTTLFNQDPPSPQSRMAHGKRTAPFLELISVTVWGGGVWEFLCTGTR